MTTLSPETAADRLTSCIRSVQSRGDRVLVTFITAGDPNLEVTADMVRQLEKAGADIIELGVPFSDPMADGPTIQLSSERALASGTTLAAILQTVREIRKTSSIPIILMGYLNPVHAYGYERFARDAAEAGVDGVLLVDMPPEESGAFLKHAHTFGLHVIFLLTPTSDDTRIESVRRLGSGFIYYVTVTGVTGVRTDVSGTLKHELDRVRSAVGLPVMAGFGVSTPEQASQVASMADGVVVGSAIVKLFEQHKGKALAKEVKRFVASLRHAVSSASLSS